MRHSEFANTIKPALNLMPRDVVLGHPAMNRLTKQSTANDDEIEKAIELVRQHACTTMSLREILMPTRLTPRSLQRRIRDRLGRTLAEERSEVRLHQAKKRLAGTTDSITSIALATGYQESASFTRWFRQCTGLAPKDYRRKFGTNSAQPEQRT